MGIEENERVCKYLNEIILKVRNKEAHEEIKLELISHIEELYEGYVESGIEKDEAIRNAIAQMGNADIIGEKLDKVHRGSPEWGIVVATALMSFIGIFTAVFIGISGEVTHYNKNNGRNMIISVLIGITLAMALYKFDYRKLKKYSTHIFIGTNLLMVLSILFSNYINGSKYITIMSISINITPIYLFLMCICLPGILKNIKLKGSIGYLKLIGSYIIPIVLIAMIPDTFYTLIYTCVFIAVLINNKYSRRVISSLGITYIAAIVGIVLQAGTYARNRLLMFLTPHKDPEGLGYINYIFNKIIKGASPLGKGNGITINELPEANTDFVFAYIIHTFGWIVAIVISVLVTFFIVRLFKSSKLIKDDFGKSIVVSLSIIFSLQFIENIFMTFNLVPVMSIGFPFISYGGTSMIINMVSIGLIMGIYKRKSYAYTI